MITAEFLSELRRLGVTLWADGETLRCSAPKTVFTAELEAEIKSRKVEILAFIRRTKEALSDLPPIKPAFRNGPAPLSFAQSRLWFLDQLEPNGAVYNECYSVRLAGAINIDAFGRALDAVVSRHETLRTTFVAVDGIPTQVILKDRRLDLKIIDLSRAAASNRETEARRLVTEEAARPFNLSSDLMLRASLVRLGPEEHLFLVVMHHIASDGWSFGVLFSELSALYKAYCDGTPSPLAELPIQYADYAAYQREHLQGAELEKQISYWKKQLKDARFTLDFPTDRPRPATQTYRGARQPVSLSKSVTESLKTLSRREGTTLFMTLLAAFNVLLHRYSGQQDIVVGSPAAGRSRIETEVLIGFFVNNLVLRTDCSGNPSFRELLARVREVAVGAYEHQDIPFEKLVDELQPERDLSRNPIFQVMIALQDALDEEIQLPGLVVQRVDVHNGTAKFDLWLSLNEERNQLNGVLEYNTDLFDEETIKRIASRFQNLLVGIVANPEQRIGDLPLISWSERHQLLVGWNHTKADYPADALFHQLFEAQVVRAPERTALRAGAELFSYAELNARACRIARVLRLHGVGRGQRVGLCVERGADMLAAVLGILKAGAAYVPLDPAFPQERLRFMAEDAQLALLVCSSALAGSFGLPRERQLLLDADAAALASQSDRRLSPDAALDARPEDPAYVIYTSGSTGKPKGVVVPHRAVVNFLTSMAREPGLAADDVLVAVTTLSFDIAVLELQLPLTLGATVVIASLDEAMDGHALKGLLEQHRATVMQATPVTWRLLLEADWKGGRDFKALVGGEALPKDLADQLIARGVELWNLYGPTETTVWSTCARIADTSNGITIGKPIANTMVYILDAQKNLCPIGIPGELCIGGDGVTLGYWNRPELTAERFIADPYSSTPGARLYRTGDLARWRSDGMLEHLGRLDFQIKLRGFRIEAGEIEACMAQHPAVREVVVIAREDVPGDQRLAAYLVTQNPPADLVDQLRARLHANLPEYMVPTQFVRLEALPRTQNGKVNRKGLPAPALSAAEDRRSYAAPSTATENAIAQIWSAVLGIEKVGVNDNFFDLGGHSLLLLRAHSRLCASLRPDLPFVALMQYPTVRTLAGYVSGTAEQSVVPAVAADRARKNREAMLRQRSVRGKR